MRVIFALIQLFLIAFTSVAMVGGNIPPTIFGSAILIWSEIVLLRKDLEERP